MSAQGQGQGQGTGAPGGGKGQGAEHGKGHQVAMPFTDKSGRQWQQGQEYTGSDQNEIDELVRAGKLRQQ